MRFIYSLLSYLLLPFAIFKLAKQRKLPRLSERLGFIKPMKADIIWLHCVSVGEFLAARVLIDRLLKTHKMLITTTTRTGSVEVLKHYQHKVEHLYFPFDCPLIVKRYIKKINPKMVLIMETEIWANLIHYLHKNQVPTLLINARLSDKSFKKYQKFSKFTQQILNKFSRILTQNNSSKQRFIKLGTQSDKVHAMGNIKFDFNIKSKTSLACLEKIDKKVVVFASTHEGEEKQILDAYLKIQERFKALLIIVPRHPERFNQVFALIKSPQLKVCKRSDKQINTDCEIMLGDSMGELMNYFKVADVVFMGGSLNDTGGHNMLEPAALSKPILFGESVFNFAEIASDLLAQKGAIQVQNADTLLMEIATLLDDEKQSKTLGDNAHQYFKSKQGSLNNLMRHIELFF